MASETREEVERKLAEADRLDPDVRPRGKTRDGESALRDNALRDNTPHGRHEPPAGI
ncbi:hypothetical protein [Gordonia paraffinivorans]|uniref:hypothetical protein n=1 Tax=Gordonia paraffinivorans TaxID=175628 RepID=UPI00242F49AE|nr:hypothetical protein [Gordonia paraffinivorans]